MVLLHLAINAQVSAPKFSNEFLNLGVGARSIGMAGAHVSMADDVTASYWNPAGMLRMKQKYQLGAMHAEYFAGIAQYDYLGFAMRLDSSSVFGLTAIRFGIDDIPDTRFLFDANGNIDYDRVQFFSASDYAFLFSYAKRVKNIAVGGSFKLIYRNVGQFANAWGFGIDAGMQTNIRKWEVGVSLRDASNTFNAWFVNADELDEIFAQTGNEIPSNSLEITLPRLIPGIHRKLTLKDSLFYLTPVLDLETTFDGKRNTLIRANVFSVNPRLGFESTYKDLYFLRMGVSNFQQVKNFDGGADWQFQPNFGVGFKFKSFSIDYALSDLGDVSDALFSNIFSLKVDIQ